ncbi:MAG: hypothetical protein KAQ85_10220, partial [Thermodesulfovibrionia bacterium]|nr:hypothetical protein [Thermodesulfovibrionia bacterium]
MKDKGYDARFERDPEGRLVRIKTDSQFADTHGFYIDENNQKQSLEEYIKVEDRDDDSVLRLDYMQDGTPYWQKASMYDELKNSEIRSANGSQRMFNSWYTAAWDGFSNSLYKNIPSLVGTGAEMFGEIAKWDHAVRLAMHGVSWDAAKNHSLNKELATDKFGNYWQNFSGMHYAKPSHNVETSHFTDNAEAFWYGGGAAIGSAAQSWAVGAPLRLVGAGAKASGLFSTTVLSMAAGDAVKRQSDEMDIPEHLQPFVYFPSMLASFGIERYVGRNILTDGIKNARDKGLFRKWLSESLGEHGVALGKDMTEEVADKVGKTYASKMMNGIKSLAVA